MGFRKSLSARLGVTMGRMIKRGILAGIAAAIVFVVSGCISLGGEPRPRLAGYPASTIGSRFIDADNLGKHSYGLGFSESAGMAYTCKGGHIDMDHLRIAADYTKYLSEKTYARLLKSDKTFTFNLNVDPSKYFVELEYPDNWKDLPKEGREKISKEVSIELGEYLTFTMVNWHEILTWYGFRSVGFFPEFPSAFSWEDVYSNLLGTRLAAQALKETSKGYDETMTILIKNELENLGVQSASTSRHASEKMRGKWFTGIVLPDIKERNMDIGLDDGFVTPTLVPGICPDAQPQSYPAPALENFYKYGFRMRLEVEPRIWEQHKIFKVVYPKGDGTRIKLPEHLPIIIENMKEEAQKLAYHTLPEK
jgi:hypothetical protein